MSEKRNSKRFYWLKLPKGFFKRHDIRIIESLENGKDYLLFYLKLLTESISYEGELRFSDTIPYDAKMLATITNTNVDVVKSAIKLFKELHLLEIWDDETLFLVETRKLLGSETEWAGKKRKQRLKEKQKSLKNDETLTITTKNSGTMSPDSPKNVLIEKEIELEIELEIDNTNTNILSFEKPENAKNEQEIEKIKEIVEYLNLAIGKNYRATTPKTQTLIRSRLKEHFTVEDFKTVIDKKSKEWLKTEMEIYLRPETLFGTKFEGYLNQITSTAQKQAKQGLGDTLKKFMGDEEKEEVIIDYEE